MNHEAFNTRGEAHKDIFSLFEVLEQKNAYLLEFHKINMHELNRLAEGRIDNLENFYYSRELLLDAICDLDHKISSESHFAKDVRIDETQKKKLLDILNLKRNMVISILDQDLAIISLVDQIKQGKKINLKARVS